MAGLPRKYAKMGFSRGWRAYKASKRSSAPRIQAHTRHKRSVGGYKMARRKRRSFGSAAKGITGQVMPVVVGAGAAYAYDRFVEPMIPVANPTAKQAIGVGAGLLLTTMRSPMAKNAGKGIAIINAYQLIAGVADGTSSVSEASSW